MTTGTIGSRPGPIVGEPGRFVVIIEGNNEDAQATENQNIVAAFSAILSLQYIISRETVSI